MNTPLAQANNRWTDFMFTLLTHETLIFDNYLCLKVDDKGNTIENFGWIIPTSLTMDFIRSSLANWGLPGAFDFRKEFEKEITLNRHSVKVDVDALRYLYELQYHFKVVTDRIPQYVTISDLLTVQPPISTVFMERDERSDLETLSFVMYFHNTISFVSNTITIAINTTLAVIRDTLTRIEQAGLSIDDRGNIKSILTSGPRDPLPAKIKVLCKVSVFGRLIQELMVNGYLEQPVKNNQWNYLETARMLMDAFEINTSLGNLSREISEETNSLSETKREKLRLPHHRDLL